MSEADGKIFRGLEDDFKNDLLRGELRPILNFEKKYRDVFLVEIRNNYLDLYFLGHAIKVEQTGSEYKLNSAYAFLPADKFKKWPILFTEIKQKYKNGFEGFMLDDLMPKIVKHKMGDISEGVSEMNHYISNRIAKKTSDILCIDRQVTYRKARIDILGLKRQNNGDYGFVVIELKNKENKDIESVFSQTKEYIDILWEHYNDFRTTYKAVIEQKIYLRLLDRRNRRDIVDKPNKKEIEGIVILDNYNLRSKLLEKALEDWKEVCNSNSYTIKLFLKPNTIDDRFLWDYQKACEHKIR